jgi:transposase-like protein
VVCSAKLQGLRAYLHTLRSCDIPPLRFHGAPGFSGKQIISPCEGNASPGFPWVSRRAPLTDRHGHKKITSTTSMPYNFTTKSGGVCKNCHQNSTIKNGYVRGKQRYKCHNCGYNFVLGDERHQHATELKKALSVILYSLGKSSFGFLAKLFGVSRTTTYYRVSKNAILKPRSLTGFWIQDVKAVSLLPGGSAFSRKCSLPGRGNGGPWHSS